VLPVTLFLVTCLSTFWAGATSWMPANFFFPTDAVVIRHVIAQGWRQGLVYMAALLGILLMHEMGHFITTLRYRIPASLPYFIPFPIAPIGTMGAVIGMEGFKANRRQMFDIGIAGPIAGLVVAVPVLWIGIQRLDLEGARFGGMAFDCPLLVHVLIGYLRPEFRDVNQIWLSQLNPFFMAGWVGLLITGLNMLPVSQLDGGHVIYALFRQRAHLIARAFLLCAIAFVVFEEAYIWTVMVVLVTLIGTDHPPTSNDRVPLGWFRTLLGYASLLIPVLCFPLRGVIQIP
jgi:membrane-associated protease RseP (regulator of RpoE activity)